MGLGKLVQARLAREAFLPGPLAILTNPVYLIRRGLYRAVRDLAPRVTGRVLDFGCGSKPYLPLFAHAEAYVGVDVAVSGHSHADSRVDVFYDGRTLPFDAATFDGVVSFEVFEHVFNLPEALDEIRRVLKPGGRLLATVPFAWDEHEAPYDFARYTTFGLRHVLETSGFRIIEMRKTTTSVAAIAQMFIAYVAFYVLPHNRVVRAVGQVLAIAPMTVLALIADALLPKRDQTFSNIAVLAERRD